MEGVYYVQLESGWEAECLASASPEKLHITDNWRAIPRGELLAWPVQ